MLKIPINPNFFGPRANKLCTYIQKIYIKKISEKIMIKSL
jgi:hypothetical protein